MCRAGQAGASVSTSSMSTSSVSTSGTCVCGVVGSVVGGVLVLVEDLVDLGLDFVYDSGHVDVCVEDLGVVF